MSEEKKENLTPEAESESLKKELEELKDTFQAAYDETVKEEQSAPVIQELEEEAVEEEEEEETEENNNPYPYAQSKASKKNKKENKKKGSKLPIIIPLVLCLLIILPLGAYVATTIAVPDFSDFMSCVVSAKSSKEPADAIDSYNDALEYCKENEFLKAYEQIIHENIVFLTYEDTGIADAYAYMNQNLSAEQIASPATKELKKFIKVIDKIDAISNKAYDAVKNAFGDYEEVPSDYNALLEELDVPNDILTDVAKALNNIATAIIKEKTAKSKDDMKEVATAYMSAYTTFSGLGAKAQHLLEVMALTMYDHGFVYEAKFIFADYLTDEMLASPMHEEIPAAIADIETIKTYEGSLYTAALKAFEDGKTSEDDLSSYIKTELSDKIKATLVEILKYCLDAVKAEKEHNLTKANANFSAAAELCTTFELKQPELTRKVIAILYSMGEINSANTLATESLTKEEVEQSDDDFKALYEELTLAYAAMDAANEAFYPHYYNYSYSGAAIDKTKAFADLDALIKEDSNKYDKAFVDYYKYLIEGFTDGDTKKMSEYLSAFAEALPAAKFIYGYGLIDNYIAEKDSEKALALAKELLEINIADDYCNMIVALELRKAGNLKEALETAVNCVENSGEYIYSAREAIILYMLDGNFEKAYEYAEILYEESFTIESCEIMYVLANEYLKEVKDEELKEDLEYYIEYIDYVYSNYAVSHTDATNGIIKGELTLKDVFLSEKYDYDLV